MAIQTGDNFLYRGRKPLDSRIIYDTIASMKTVADATIYDGAIAFNQETSKYYNFLSSNTIDTVLGKWREFELGGSSLVEYKANTEYEKDDLVYLNDNLARVVVDYTSNTPTTPTTLNDQFENDITNNKLVELGGSEVEVKNEDITFDGISKKFNLVNNYSNVKNIIVTINGLQQRDNDYTIDTTVTPNTIEFTDIYDTFDQCIVEYQK